MSDSFGKNADVTVLSNGDRALKVDVVQSVGGEGSPGGGLTNDELRASPVPVSGTFYQATQPVSIASAVPVTDNGGSLTVDGTVAVSNFPSTQPVSGTVTANAGTGTFAVSAAALPLPSGAATATKQPALGTAGSASSDVLTVQGIASMTALKVDGSAVTQPVSGTFWQATQPVSGTVAVSNFPATQAVTGTFWQATQPVSGTFWQATQPISGSVSVSNFPSTQTVTVTGSTTVAQSIPANLKGEMSLGMTQSKTNTMKTGTLATTTANADQVILTYTVTAGKTFYMQYFEVVARLTTFATTATNFGTFSLESPAATKLYTSNIFHAGDMDPRGVWFAEPVPIGAGVVVRIVCTPGAAANYTWTANFGGYEK
jgi:hypothetical protein